MRPFVLLPIVLLAGCAATGGSYVDGSFAPTDAATLATDMTAFIKSNLPPASSTLVLDPPPAGQASNALTPAFAASLRQAGFAVALAATPGAHRIRYLVTPLEGGTLVRLTIDGTEASRFFTRDPAGGLQARGPFMVREASS
jgi:hypothetical protein